MFTYSLAYTTQDGRTAGMSGGCETLPDTLTDAGKMVAYYRDLGYTVAVEFIRECCPECKGEGTLPIKRNKFKRKECKACKASGAKQILQSA